MRIPSSLDCFIDPTFPVVGMSPLVHERNNVYGFGLRLDPIDDRNGILLHVEAAKVIPHKMTESWLISEPADCNIQVIGKLAHLPERLAGEIGEVVVKFEVGLWVSADAIPHTSPAVRRSPQKRPCTSLCPRRSLPIADRAWISPRPRVPAQALCSLPIDRPTRSGLARRVEGLDLKVTRPSLS